MITFIIFIAILMIMFTVSRVNGASTRRRRRRGIDWSGLKPAEPPPEKGPEEEDALKKPSLRE